ncbi:hypothetical protein Tco_0957358 [Tanacetum coccineum]
MENEHELSYETLTRVYLGSYEHYKGVGAEVEHSKPGFELQGAKMVETGQNRDFRLRTARVTTPGLPCAFTLDVTLHGIRGLGYPIMVSRPVLIITLRNGWACAFHQTSAFHQLSTVANVTLISSAHLLRENTDSVRVPSKIVGNYLALAIRQRLSLSLPRLLDNVVEEENGEWICFLGGNSSPGTKKYRGLNSNDGGNTGDGVKIVKDENNGGIKLSLEFSEELKDLLPAEAGK